MGREVSYMEVYYEKVRKVRYIEVYNEKAREVSYVEDMYITKR